MVEQPLGGGPGAGALVWGPWCGGAGPGRGPGVGAVINPCLLHVAVLLQVDEDVVEPEASQNPTQSFESHNIVWRRTQLLALIICIL